MKQIEKGWELSNVAHPAHPMDRSVWTIHSHPDPTRDEQYAANLWKKTMHEELWIHRNRINYS
jgi:hypothetical protein